MPSSVTSSRARPWICICSREFGRDAQGRPCRARPVPRRFSWWWLPSPSTWPFSASHSGVRSTVWRTVSLASMPSRMATTRSTWRAMPGSWLTMIVVIPISLVSVRKVSDQPRRRRVDLARRLVGQQQGRDDSASPTAMANALLLAAGKLRTGGGVYGLPSPTSSSETAGVALAVAHSPRPRSWARAATLSMALR